MNRELKEKTVKKVTREMTNISKLVCKHARLEPERFAEGDSGDRELVAARYLAIYICRHYTAADNGRIAQFFEIKPPTITYALKSVEKALAGNRLSQRWLKDLAAKVIKDL